jgi:predicted metal-dependent enzyme (double-stranded beta helix superfamily)
MTIHPTPRFAHFVQELTHLVDDVGPAEEDALRRGGRALLQALVANDDWLPEEFAQPHPQYYQQYLLYADPQNRFSVVSFVWGPGQKTPVHDHTVWALIGMLCGSERGERFALAGEGRPMRRLGEDTLHPGEVDEVSPTIGDIHRVSNALDDQVSISIHVYGGNIGRISRHVYDVDTGATKTFVSGYSNETTETGLARDTSST